MHPVDITLSAAAALQLDSFMSCDVSYTWLASFEFPPPSDSSTRVDVSAAFVRRRAKTNFGIVSAVLVARIANNIARLASALVDQAAIICFAGNRTRISPRDIVGAQSLLAVMQQAQWVSPAKPPPRRKVQPATKRARTQMLVVVEEKAAEEKEDEDAAEVNLLL